MLQHLSGSKILINLNDTLNLILEFYIGNINKSDRYFSNKITDSIRYTLEKSNKEFLDLWMASKEILLENINEKLDSYFDNSISVEDVKQDNEYGFYESITFKYNEESNLKWIFKYSYLNEAIIIIDENNRIISFISLDDENLKYKKDADNIPIELEKFDLYVPIKLLEYEENKLYDIKSRSSTLKIKCEDNSNARTLINMYLKNCK